MNSILPVIAMITAGVIKMTERGFDGFQHRSEKPTISLVCFGSIEHDLEDTMIHSLESLVDSLEEFISARPVVSCFHEPDPLRIPAVNQEEAYFPLLARNGGNIVLGVTNTGFFDPYKSRNIFGYGHVDGRGALSTLRFRSESTTRKLFLERMGKQILKTLAMACTVGACDDNGCIVSYHRWAKDLDRNQYVCEPCRQDLIRNLKFFLNVQQDKNSALIAEGD
jgi:predicted Zn-dependent protease